MGHWAHLRRRAGGGKDGTGFLEELLGSRRNSKLAIVSSTVLREREDLF